MVTLGANKDMIQIINNSSWQIAKVADIKEETPTIKTFTFEMPTSVNHNAGQHYEIRLTSSDGYQAARLYSAASYKKRTKLLELTIELMPDGEVSPYMFNRVRAGDKIEIRGPLGKFFVWNEQIKTPVLLIGGGSGVVPMRCILQAHRQASSAATVKLLYSARSEKDIIYGDELTKDRRAAVTLTNPTDSWTGNKGRIDQNLIKETIGELADTPICFVCGSNQFVEAMINLLLSEGVPPSQIKAERFGG